MATTLDATCRLRKIHFNHKKRIEDDLLQEIKKFYISARNIQPLSCLVCYAKFNFKLMEKMTSYLPLPFSTNYLKSQVQEFFDSEALTNVMKTLQVMLVPSQTTWKYYCNNQSLQKMKKLLQLEDSNSGLLYHIQQLMTEMDSEFQTILNEEDSSSSYRMSLARSSLPSIREMEEES